MSHASSPYTTFACLLAAEGPLGPGHVWNPVSDVQRAWLEHGPRLMHELGLIPEIEPNATFKVDDHVAFMAKHGFEAQITEKVLEDDFLMAAIMSVAGKWQEEGVPDLMSTEYGYRHAVRILGGAQILKRRGTEELVACLATQTGDTVWMEMMPSAPEGFSLAVHAQSRFSGDFEPVRGYDGVTFPCIDFKGTVDNGWLRDLWTLYAHGRRAKIRDAKAQLELKMNHVGFRARAADEMLGGSESTGPCTLQINQPFLMAVKRPGLSLPPFAAHLEPDDWNKPELDL